ncbi:MAG: lasso peptide biosynthesis B2 protein, partial [Citromicrobium sp.]
MATVDYETMHFSANFDFASGALALAQQNHYYGETTAPTNPIGAQDKRLPAPMKFAPLLRATMLVSAVALRLPGRTSCLIEALAVEAMLRRRGHECELRLGVPRASAAHAGFAAHAWIES